MTGLRRSWRPRHRSDSSACGTPRYSRITRYSSCWTSASWLWPRSQDVVLAAEADRQAEILQFHEVDVARRVLRRALEHVEELLAAPRLAVERHEQRVLAPLALRAPRRREHRLVERRAQRVARGQHHLVRDARRLGALLERPNLGERVLADAADVAHRERAAQPAGEQQQRTRGADQGIEAGAEQVSADRGHRLGRLGWRVRRHHRLPRGGRIGLPPLPAAGPRARRRFPRLERIVDVGHGGGPDQLRIAQNSSARPGNSPATCIARPPEVSSWAHRSFD